MANEIKIKVTMDNATGPAAAGLKAELKDVETSADKAGTGVKGLGKELGGLKGGLKDAEGGLKDVGGATAPVIEGMRQTSTRLQGVQDDLRKLDEGIKVGKTALQDLSSAFAQTDDAAQRLDIKKAMNKVKSDLSSASSAKKIKLSELMDLKPDPQTGSNIFKSLSGSIKEGFSSGGAAAIIAPIAVALSPMLGGLIAAAVLGGSGTLGIIGGVALAARSPAVKAAGADLGSTVLADLTSRAKVFLNPVIYAIGDIKKAYQGISSEIGTTFNVLAGYLRPLTDSLVKGATEVLRGIMTAAQGSGPVLQAFGDMFVAIGGHLKGFFENMVTVVPQAVTAIGWLTKAITFTIDALKFFVDAMAGSIIIIQSVGKAFSSFLHSATEIGVAIDYLSGGFKGAADRGTVFKDAIDGTAGALLGAVSGMEALTVAETDAAAAADGHREALSALSKELKAETDPVFGLLNASEKLALAQDAYQKAVDNGTTGSKKGMKALQDMALAAIEMEDQSGKLGASFNGKLTPAMIATLRSAGLNIQQIHQLALQFAAAKKQGDTFAKNYKASAAITGIPGVQQKVQSITDDLRAFQGRWTATMIVNYQTFGKPGSGGGLATGGIVGGSASGATPSGLTWVGERGPELISAQPGSRVWSHGDSARMAGGAGGGSVTLKFAPSGHRVLDELFTWFLERMQSESRTKYSSNPIAMLGGTGH